MRPQTLYVVKRADGLFDLRQIRYRDQFFAGKEHPHDLMAAAFTAEAMSKIIDSQFCGDTDKSALSL